MKPLTACRTEVERSDALIVIVGHRYGIPSEAEGGDGAKNITSWEVQWALDAEKPVFAFLVDKIAVSADVQELEKLKGLEAFRTFLKQNSDCAHFTSVSGAGEAEATGITNCPIKFPRTANERSGIHWTPPH